MKNQKKLILEMIVLGFALGGASSVFAASESFVGIEGKIDNFSETSVDLTTADGTEVRVPRTGIRPKDAELKAGNTILAIVEPKEIQPVLKRKSK